MNRRSFIGLAGAAALGCATRNNTPTFDENLTVLISDPHVNGDPAIVKYLYPREWLIKTVTEILAMRPLGERGYEIPLWNGGGFVCRKQ